MFPSIRRALTSAPSATRACSTCARQAVPPPVCPKTGTVTSSPLKSFILRPAGPFSGPSQSASSSRGLLSPATRANAATSVEAMKAEGSGRAGAIMRQGATMNGIGQVRGMKVRSSVKRFCDGCAVVRRYVGCVSPRPIWEVG